MWKRIFERLAAAGNIPDEILIDSTHVKAHRSLAGVKRGEAAQAIGRSYGGRISKIHAVANAEGRPLAFVPMPGNITGISAATHLLDCIALARRILADKAYDVDHLRKPLEAQGPEVVIPSTRARRRPHPLNRRAYRGRNLIERMLRRMKDYVASPPATTVSPETSCLPSHSSQPFASGSPDWSGSLGPGPINEPLAL
ncbi:IS5 family transposase [Pseudoroseomonas wenyumeiae]